jgi:hypothetical protein
MIFVHEDIARERVVPTVDAPGIRKASSDA